MPTRRQGAGIGFNFCSSPLERVLQYQLNQARVRLRGIIVAETDDCIRFSLEQAWDIDIYKSMILAVEQDRCARILVN
jgi:hypothetical protein